MVRRKQERKKMITITITNTYILSGMGGIGENYGKHGSLTFQAFDRNSELNMILFHNTEKQGAIYRNGG